MFGISYFSVVTQSNSTVVDGVECPAYVGNHPYRPQLPAPISGFASQPDGTQVAYFTAGSIAAGGPAFRVRAEKLTGGLVQVQAQTLVDQASTLHTLFLVELAVTAGALVFALAAGWWLVRLGLRPLEDVERTADSIAAGNLDQRVPGADRATEVGRLARALNVMLERIQTAFSARLASEARLKENEHHLRQFVADASHELRTPIAAVSAYAELFERGGTEHTADQPRIAAGIRTERRAWTAWSAICSPWPAWTRACPWRWRPSSWCPWRRMPCGLRPPSDPTGRCGSGPPTPLRCRATRTGSARCAAPASWRSPCRCTCS